ncbi:MAG: DNA polymerase III subunit delta [Christensenellales bacterium]
MPNKDIYIFAGDSYMIKQSLIQLRQSLDIQYEQINTTYYERMPKADELYEACVAVPFMSDIRLVAVGDCSVLTAKGSAEEAKKVAAFIDKIPHTTALALCTDNALDKRRALYKQVKNCGQIKEFTQPSLAECISFVIKQALKQGAAISKATAAELVALIGFDYYALENEIAKLAVYSGYNEITAKHLTECASKSLEYNIFEIHGLFLNKQAAKAQVLLTDILRSERPEAVVGLFAKKIRDMYKVRTMLDAGFSIAKVTKMANVTSFVVQILKRECKAFTQEELRNALVALADLDYAVKSGEKEAALALTETLVRIYKL